MSKWDDKIWEGRYYWVGRYNEEPDTIIMSYKDFQEFINNIQAMMPPFHNLSIGGKYKYMGMDIIATNDLEAGDIRVCKSKTLTP